MAQKPRRRRLNLLANVEDGHALIGVKNPGKVELFIACLVTTRDVATGELLHRSYAVHLAPGELNLIRQDIVGCRLVAVGLAGFDPELIKQAPAPLDVAAEGVPVLPLDGSLFDDMIRRFWLASHSAERISPTISLDARRRR